MSKEMLRQQSEQAMMKFILSGGKIQVVKICKVPKQLTAGAGSVKHCGRTNKFGQRI